MKETTNNYNSKDTENNDEKDLDDLDNFIEKRKIQNEALRKIVSMNLPSSEKKKKGKKEK